MEHWLFPNCLESLFYYIVTFQCQNVWLWKNTACLSSFFFGVYNTCLHVSITLNITGTHVCGHLGPDMIDICQFINFILYAKVPLSVTEWTNFSTIQVQHTFSLTRNWHILATRGVASSMAWKTKHNNKTLS